jgi:hypothetical protein
MSESMRAECGTHDCNGHNGCGGCISHSGLVCQRRFCGGMVIVAVVGRRAGV